VDFLACDFFPDAIFLHLEPDLAGLLRIERVELGVELQHAVVDGVEAEGDDLVARHLEIDDRIRRALPPGVGAE
jgi:hypothetical protein